MPYSDADLVACVVRLDDRDAFAELVRRHQSPVRQLLRRLSGGDTSLADDLAQETFVRVYRKLGIRSRVDIVRLAAGRRSG